MNWVMAFLVLVIAIMFSSAEFVYDSTDNQELEIRSGLTLFTDNKTCLQYLRGGVFGGIIQRLDSDGNHMKDEKCH